LPPEPFDVVVAAASFHWLDPDVRTAKVAHALRSSGALAIISTVYAADGDQAFLDQLQACHQR
jgi:trans-aconitate methyltransferase